MYREFTFWIGIISVVLFLASLGAFLLYVPVLSVMTVSTTLLGLILMFILGIQTGSRRSSIAQEKKHQDLGLHIEAR